MASITIRNLDPAVKRGLRIRAARHGVSMEAEVRSILRSAALDQSEPPQDLATAIRTLFAPTGGVDLELPLRDGMRAPPKFR